MDIKKNKKLKKKYDGFFHGYNTFAGVHLYRSEDLDAPFSEWRRLTDKPMSEAKFSDNYSEEDEDKTYYYKFTKVDIFGKESPPFNPARQAWIDKGGKSIERKAETNIYGRNVYWSINPDLPLDRWARLNDKPTTDDSFSYAPPVEGIYYIYAKFVNELGEEFGEPSEILKIVPQA